ncbi:MAG: hypothetical protein JO144_04335 [Actinobacteria bacterium]|nr:hypothetical protein [Actinomycetota bacterium]
MKLLPTSVFDQLVGACCSVLAAAVALYLAARLIELVWLPLLLIALVVGLVVGALVLLRRRRQGW